MKTKSQAFYLICVVMFILTSCGGNSEEKHGYSDKDSLRAKISFSGAFALYPMAVKWTEEYHKLYPHVTFDVQAGGAGKGLADALSGMVDAGMVSRSISPEETAKGAWPVTVAKDAVVATVNAENPFLALLNGRGVTKEQFKKIWIDGTIRTWGDLLGNGSKQRIQVFTRSDAAGAPETWAKYLGGKQEDLKGIGVFGDPGVAESVVQDKFSIGFNNVNYVYDMTSKRPFEGLRAVPIDLDGSGTLDEKEKFYDDIDGLNHAIVEGVFPSPPARDLYFVFRRKPSNAAIKKFMKWVLTDGQQYVAASGYVKLDDEQLTKELGKLK